MSASKFSPTFAGVLLCLTVSITQCCVAQEWTKDPTTWWPDPSTGLMWSGQIHSGPSTYPKLAVPSRSMYWMGLNWPQASDYCDSLALGGTSGWRLPTLDEVEGAVEIIKVNPGPVCPSADVAIHGGCRDQDLAPGAKYSGLALRGQINLFDQSMTIWTATPSQTNSQSAWTVGLTPIPNSFSSLVEVTKASLSQTDSKSSWESELKSVQWTPLSVAQKTEVYMGVVCVRHMEPDLLQTAKAASVNHPVPDIQTLQNFISLNRARLAYQAGDYQESIAQAQIAISLKADPATATWGIGISYGRLGQWDQAIANLQSALAINKNFTDATTALKWAKDGLKAAKKGKLPKEPNPMWN
ncbi:MAG: DUF1566 domain-containing protein [Acidobacteriaceae bacterium]